MLRLASSVNSALLRRLALAIGLSLSFLTTAYAAALSPESAQTGTYVYQVVRNGVAYSGNQAMQWLRWKRTHPQYKDNPIRTPDDFIERVADGSRNTGLPYEVILPDGRRERLKNLLHNELVSLEAAKKSP